MGRSNFKSVVPRAYCFVPIPCTGADVSGTTDYNTSIAYSVPFGNATAMITPLSGVPTTVPPFMVSSDLRPNAFLSGVADKQAIMWSAVSIAGSAGTVNFDLRSGTVSGPTLTTPLALTPPLTHPSGVIEGSWRATSTGAPVAMGNGNRLVGATGGRTCVPFFDASDASHGVTRPGVCVVYAAGILANGGGSSTPIVLDRPYTFFPGVTKGFYATVPMEGGDLASGQTAQTVRRITMPMAVRIHSVCFQSGASGAGNTVKLRNVTQNVDITGATALVTATGDAVEVAAANLSNRNVAKGDVLEIQATTSGTGFTSLGATIGCHTTGFIHTTSPLLDLAVAANTSSTLEPSGIFRNKGTALAARTSFSGPATGSIAFLPWPVRLAIPINQTDYVVGRVIAPFDCYAWNTNVFYRASGAGNVYTIRNITKSLNIIAAQAVTSGSSAWDVGTQAELANNSISKGDVLELRVTTGGAAGFAAICGSIAVHNRGHINTSPAFD